MNKFNLLALVLFAVALAGCKDDSETMDSDYSKMLIGTWRQDKVFNIVDATSQPLPVGDWFDPENRAQLILQANGTFYYDRYEGCTIGEYTFQAETGIITFTFECAVDYFGVETSEVSEHLFMPDKKTLSIDHNALSLECTNACLSFFKKLNQ